MVKQQVWVCQKRDLCQTKSAREKLVALYNCSKQPFDLCLKVKSAKVQGTAGLSAGGV